MSALRGRVHKRDYILPGGDRYVAWVAEVTRPDPIEEGYGDMALKEWIG